MKRQSFWKETAVASVILAGLACIGIGMELLRTTARFNRASYNDAEQFARFGLTLIGFGLVLIIVSVLFGAFVAFGLGPNFLAKTVEGAVVEERFLTSPEGEPILDASPDDYDRCYLRLRMPSGEVVEARCSAAIYRSAHTGTAGTVRLMGERMVSFEIGG